MHDASPMQPRERPRDGADNGHRLPHAEVAAGSDDTRERPGAHQVEHEGHGPGGLHQREGLVEPDEPLHTDPLEHGKLATAWSASSGEPRPRGTTLMATGNPSCRRSARHTEPEPPAASWGPTR